MSFQKFKSDLYCAGGRHRLLQKTYLVVKLLEVIKCELVIFQFVIEKTKTVSNNTIGIESFGDFFKSLGENSVKVVYKLSKTVLKNPGRALETSANASSAFLTKNPTAAFSSLPEKIKFIKQAKDYTLINLLIFIPSKWNTKQQSHTLVHH